MSQIINITDLRKNLFELLTAVGRGGKVLDVVKGGKRLVRISKYVEEKFDWEKYMKKQKKTSEVLKKMDWSYLKGFRKEFDRDTNK